MTAVDPTRDKQLVTVAREVERLLARRRKRVKALAEVDEELRKMLRDLTAPDPTEVYREPLPIEDGA